MLLSSFCLPQEKNIELSELTIQDFKLLSDLFGSDVSDVWDYEKAVERRDATGGTSRRAVLEQVDKIERFCSTYFD